MRREEERTEQNRREENRTEQNRRGEERREEKRREEEISIVGTAINKSESSTGN